MLEKTITLLANQSLCSISYSLRNNGKNADEFRLGTVLGLTPPYGNAAQSYYQIKGKNHSLQGHGELLEVGEVNLVDERMGFALSLALSKPATLWRLPLESAGGVYQGSILMPYWRLHLKPGETGSVTLTLRFEER